MQDLDTVLLLLFTFFFSQIILGLAVLPGGESGAPGGAARPNGPPRQRENCTVRKCVVSLRCAVKRNANEVKGKLDVCPRQRPKRKVLSRGEISD